MKLKFLTLSLLITLLSTSCTTASTSGSSSGFDLKDILTGGSDAASTIGNILEGVFTTSDLEVKDLAGEWTSTGSAVQFQSDNFLAKAGGLAGAAAIETKLDPYYKQYGLTGAVITIASDGTFQLQIKKMTLSGVITKLQDGNFNMSFQALGAFSLGNMTTYISKSPTAMNMMFDATKLKSILQIAATFSGSKLAQTGIDILNSYEGICVGFKLSKTGNASSTSTQQNESTTGSTLLDILTGSKK